MGSFCQHDLPSLLQKSPARSKLQPPSSPSKLSRLLPGKPTKKSARDEHVLSPSNRAKAGGGGAEGGVSETNGATKTIEHSTAYNNKKDTGPSPQSSSADSSIEAMSQLKGPNPVVKSIAHAQADGYTIGVVNKWSPSNNNSRISSLNRSKDNYVNMYKKETEVRQEERPVDRNNVTNSNFQIYQNINVYRKERTMAPVVSDFQSERSRADSGGRGEYVVYNVQNGAIHHGQGSTPPRFAIGYQRGVGSPSAQRKHARSRTADFLDAKSSTESLGKSALQDTAKNGGKHGRSKSADPYERDDAQLHSSGFQESKEKPKSSSKLLFMRGKLKKKDPSEKKEEKDKGLKIKFKKGAKSASKAGEDRNDRGQALLDMQLPRRESDEPGLNESHASGSRHSSFSREDDVFAQNCDVHVNGNQVPRPLHRSAAASGYSMSYDQIASGKATRGGRTVSRSHDQLPQQPFMCAANVYGEARATPLEPEMTRGIENYGRHARQSRPRTARSQTITLDSRSTVPTSYHSGLENSAHALALSGGNAAVIKNPTLDNVYANFANRVVGYHSDTHSDDNSSVHSNPNYSDVYANTNQKSSVSAQHQPNSQHSNIYQTKAEAISQGNNNIQVHYAGVHPCNAGQSQHQSGFSGNYADVYQGDPATQAGGGGKRSGYAAMGGGAGAQLAQIPELNENTASLRRTRTGRGMFAIHVFEIFCAHIRK